MLHRHAWSLVVCVALACSSSSDKPPQNNAPAEAETKREAEPPEEGEQGDEEQEEAPPTDEPGGASFDADKAGDTPSSFQISETNGTRKPATWKVVADDSAPTPPNVFALTRSKNKGQTYNLAIAKEIPPSADFDLSVMLRADAGREDRGGGLAFRLKGPGDYYIARWNPLERNAKFYVVRGSVRTAIAKVDIDLDPKQWHSLRVVMEGDTMEMFIDDQPVLRTQNAIHQGSGLVALWTKADAATSFDDLSLADL